MAIFLLPLLSRAQNCAPNISYTGVNASYCLNNPISTLSLNNTGGIPGNIVTTFAGTGSPGSANGTALAASFKNPNGVAIDAFRNIYVADAGNHIIRKITPMGVITTLAGSGTAGYTNGTGTAASFNIPTGVALDLAGNVYVADAGNHVIRKITYMGVVTTLAGSGTVGSTDGLGTAASFDAPSGIATDAAGDIYMSDFSNHRIRKVTSRGVVTTLAGSGVEGHINATGTAASFRFPQGVAMDTAGNVYVADMGNYLIRKITPAGVVTTFAGSGNGGSSDGTGTAANIQSPESVATDAAGNVYVADSYNNIRKITPTGVVTTLAGSGTAGSSDGTSNAASFYQPIGIVTDTAGNIYVADYYNHKIRKISPYNISPILPAGLSFSPKTGSITGKPTVESTPTTYTISTGNQCGLNSTSISFGIGTPTPITSNQSFCVSAKVANLTATGTNIKWYTSSIGGTALDSTTAIVNLNFYYATQTISGCESTLRAVVFVKIYNIPAAPTASAQTFCGPSIVTNLTASGTNIKWYAASTGGTALIPTTALVSNQTYYASQAISGCESFESTLRTAVSVTINNIPAAPTAMAQSFCLSVTVANLTATGTNIKWYAASTDGTALSSTTA
jgi:sugar lactone lactonase YvrE